MSILALISVLDLSKLNNILQPVKRTQFDRSVTWRICESHFPARNVSGSSFCCYFLTISSFISLKCLHNMVLYMRSYSRLHGCWKMTLTEFHTVTQRTVSQLSQWHYSGTFQSASSYHYVRVTFDFNFPNVSQTWWMCSWHFIFLRSLLGNRISGPVPEEIGDISTLEEL